MMEDPLPWGMVQDHVDIVRGIRSLYGYKGDRAGYGGIGQTSTNRVTYGWSPTRTYTGDKRRPHPHFDHIHWRREPSGLGTRGLHQFQARLKSAVSIPGCVMGLPIPTLDSESARTMLERLYLPPHDQERDMAEDAPRAEIQIEAASAKKIFNQNVRAVSAARRLAESYRAASETFAHRARLLEEAAPSVLENGQLPTTLLTMRLDFRRVDFGGISDIDRIFRDTSDFRTEYGRLDGRLREAGFDPRTGEAYTANG
jgi:hypothetical protein